MALVTCMIFKFYTKVCHKGHLTCVILKGFPLCLCQFN